GIHHQIVVFFGVAGERLRNKNSRIVHQQINTAEMLEGGFHHLDGGFLLADLSIHKDEIRRRIKVLRPGDGAGGGNDTPTAVEQGLCNAQADSAGSAGDDGDGLLSGLHRMAFWCFFAQRPVICSTFSGYRAPWTSAVSKKVTPRSTADRRSEIISSLSA